LRDQIADSQDKLFKAQIEMDTVENSLDLFSSIRGKKYSFPSVQRYGSDYFISTTYHDGVMDIFSETKIVYASDVALMIRPEAGSSYEQYSLARLSFTRIMDNTLEKFYEGGKEFSSTLHSSLSKLYFRISLVHLIVFLCQIAFIIIISVLIVRLIFQIMRTNKEVISLFALITPEEVRQLRNKCLTFMSQHLFELMDVKERQEYVQRMHAEESGGVASKINSKFRESGLEEVKEGDQDEEYSERQNNNPTNSQKPEEIVGKKAQSKIFKRPNHDSNVRILLLRTLVQNSQAAIHLRSLKKVKGTKAMLLQ
jgi:hypothetical protein